MLSHLPVQPAQRQSLTQGPGESRAMRLLGVMPLRMVWRRTLLGMKDAALRADYCGPEVRLLARALTFIYDEAQRETGKKLPTLITNLRLTGTGTCTHWRFYYPPSRPWWQRSANA